MRCPRCASDNPDGAKFCIECGTPLTPRCPQCGGDTLPRAKFSGECGTPLTAQTMDSALELAVRALTLSREQREQGHEVYALRLLGDIVAHRDPPEDEQADASYRQALALAEALGMRPLVAHCHCGLGTLYAKTGRREGAHVELSAAIALYRAIEMTFWLPRAEVGLAQVEAR